MIFIKSENFARTIISTLLSVIIAFLFIFLLVRADWTAPTETAPACSLSNSACNTPINVGASTQTKTGGLNITGNVGIGTTLPWQKLDVAGYIRGQSGLCMGSDCRTSWSNTGGPWQLKTKEYAFAPSCGNTLQGFTSWKYQFVYLPKYTASIDVRVDSGNRGTWIDIYGYNSSNQWTRIGYDGRDCRPDGANGVWCGWGNQNPGNNYLQPPIPSSNSYVYVRAIGYCPYEDTHNSKFTVSYWESVSATIPSSNYNSPWP